MRRTRRITAAVGLLLVPLLVPAGVGATQTLLVSVGPGFRAADLPAGVRLQEELPGVHALILRTEASRVPALLRTPAVRGVSRDVALHTTGEGPASGDGVLAPLAVGGGTGKGGVGKGVRVAVLDTGVADTRALDRASGRLLRGPDFSDDSSGLRDGYGHGTFMANLVAGASADGVVVGVAPAASVVDVKVADGQGRTSLSRVLKGLDWVATTGVDRGVRVLSLSLSADRPDGGYGADPLTDAAEAVQRAGVTVVVSAGNDPSGVSDPGHDPLLFTVGAADSASSTVASFSGRAVVAGRARPDLVAPGVRMLSYLPDDSALAQRYPAARVGRLWRGSGTSQATAVTAGAVAAFLTGREGLRPADVRASFAAVARPVQDAAAGAGLLVLPTRVQVDNGGTSSGDSSGGSSTPSSTSWSSTSWSSTSWSSTSWSSTSWSSTSWSSTSWSANGWA